MLSFGRRSVVSSAFKFSRRCVASRANRVSIVTEIADTPGSLTQFLKSFDMHKINLTHIESKPTQKETSMFQIYIDFDGSLKDQRIQEFVKELETSAHCRSMLVLDEKEVPWFPRVPTDLDFVANRTLDAGKDLESDHPGFNDPVYRARRQELAQIAIDHRAGAAIPTIKYTEDEIRTWGAVYNHLKKMHKKFACTEYLTALSLLEKNCGFSATQIPQVQDICQYLKDRTGFQLRPVAGLLSSRDFLNALAFRVFFSTQYLRHHSRPLYTPEPDICHELIGHVPMFADPDFADFSQEIGLASLGASDDEIERLAKIYWFTVEFGVVRDSESNDLKAYGAGILSSIGETEYSCTAEWRKSAVDEGLPQEQINKLYKTSWLSDDCQVEIPAVANMDVRLMTQTPVLITKYQHIYFAGKSMNDVKMKVREYCDRNMAKPFLCRYNASSEHIWVDRAVKRKAHVPVSKYMDSNV